ncbi:hypothetical protein SCAR479_03443 [Seiridium cardinale]|uniref:FHA domain-containing protein n=1 Tax=Seiridium cardinale TaxID=138064 RepID=A0ABR2Y187_9PEZI
MWLLEHEGDAFRGKRLWLRPGKRYLFGRTVAEPGMLAIDGEKSNSVSRKHIIIEVDPVRRGDSQNLSSRSKVTIEDLKSKLGTVINGQRIKGAKHAIACETNELKLGSMAGFRITWKPIVLSFSFTRKELDAGAETKLQDNLEQLDIKFIATYDTQATTHVVNKRRNTSKGLQALVNGVYIVDDGFIATIIASSSIEKGGDGVEKSALEGDFDANWPEPLKFLPAPGNEPVQRPAEAFAPNQARREMFEGYTFIFYEPKQHESLLGPITDGKGKALYKEVIPHETQIDDFIRYVKSVAGEKGLGEFEDGSEGKGVVVVRYVPADSWYEEFYTAVSLRLDHRLIDQKDFLDAILVCDASGLRRPLEVETPAATQNGPSPSGQRMQVDNERAPTLAPRSQASAPRRPVRTTRKRFKGFVADSDSDGGGNGDIAMLDDAPVDQPQSAIGESSQEGLFVSQNANSQEPDTAIQAAQRSERKRPAEQDFEEDFAPTAAQLKRRRIAAGEEPIPRRPTPEAQEQAQPETSKEGRGGKGKSPKVKKEIDVLEVARQNREETEARARAEREHLEADAEGLDLAEIRRLHIEEPMQLRSDMASTRTREQDIANGRWDPAWNGRKNFKKFRQRGAVEAARAPQRIIVALEEVRTRTGGIGDDYWLEDETTQKRKKKSQRNSQEQIRGTTGSSSRRARHGDAGSGVEDEAMDESNTNNHAPHGGVEEEDDDDDIVYSATRKRTTKSASTQQDASRSQRTTQKSQPSRSTVKRPAPTPPEKEQSAKRSKHFSLPDSDDDDESEDELRFKFKRR